MKCQVVKNMLENPEMYLHTLDDLEKQELAQKLTEAM